MRFRHTLSETFSGVRNNASMMVAIIVTMWVSLTLFGGSLLAAQQIQLMKGRWYDKVEISIFLCTKDTTGSNCTPGQDATPQQIATLERTLRSDPEVKEVYHESKQQAYDDFAASYQESPLKGTLTVDQMQESFRVKLVDPEQYRSVVTSVAGMPGVQAVQDLREIFDPLFQWLRTAQYLALGTSGLLLLAAALQIGNTIRLAIFARRREIAIMRLVGASNTYITLPFVLETLIAGVVGALFAGGTLVAGVYSLIIRKAEVSIQTLPWIGWSETAIAVAGLAIVAILLSIIPTLIATTKYLRV
ncbi:permease-like cell division protein FtsX [Raineyella fluvialis]|uniref:Cell division protein FtsX n=1 Tax=Raineyella fluvialis TaxID=2662261 RepID=A0A5Q2FDD8_9ACTN|nr:permease-like cell division protein FtsX [Raineyella fluvialis]QGF24391.1 FtsX-like permease family protein [Raineyella fluvialis]